MSIFEWRAGPRNLLTDIDGLLVGHAEDARLGSGSTAIICEEPATCAVQVLGGAPGTRETDLLSPEMTVRTVDALVLSGGSAFGLDAASGVQAWLREQGRGFQVGSQLVPIVPGAILFDLKPDTAWNRYPPYRELGYEAAKAAGREFDLGSRGAGAGATTATFKGGLGSASTLLPNGITVAALVAVNALGSATIGDTHFFHAAPFEIGNEFGGLGLPHPWPANATAPVTKFDAAERGNTTIAVIATDARLDKAAAKRLAIAAHDGFSRALWPSHLDFDGDLVFALATGRSTVEIGPRDGLMLGMAAAATMARAIARGVFAAAPLPGDRRPAWREVR